jgi:hypothetical protein
MFFCGIPKARKTWKKIISEYCSLWYNDFYFLKNKKEPARLEIDVKWDSKKHKT